MDSLAGELVAGKYRVLRLLGQGSLGTVYLCRHALDDRLAALKLPHSQLMASERFRSQFWLELVAAARLQSPNVVPIVEFGDDLELGTYYIAMPYIPHPDLGTVLRENGALPDERSAAIIAQVLETLAGAHAADIVHLNLKPSNVFVQMDSEETPRAMVADFGCARLTSHAGTHGTPEYGSPEQARGLDLDSRSDIYAVGVLLYEMLAGRRPFEAASAFELGRLHCGAPPPPPSGFRKVDPVLESVCLKALSKTPDARYQSATEMLEAFADVRKRATPRKQASRSRPVQQDSLAPFERTEPAIHDTIPKRRAGLAVVASVGLACAVWAGYGTLAQLQRSAPRGFAAASAAPKPGPQLDLLIPAESAIRAVEDEPSGETVAPAPPEPAQLVAIQSSASPPPAAAAHVTVGIVLPRGAATESLRRALDLPAITDCYRTGLAQPGAYAQPSTCRLDLECASDGRVGWAKLRAPEFSPPVRKCIERTARAARVPDTGGATLEASILLEFAPR